jgi:hypothetical protein
VTDGSARVQTLKPRVANWLIQVRNRHICTAHVHVATDPGESSMLVYRRLLAAVSAGSPSALPRLPRKIEEDVLQIVTRLRRGLSDTTRCTFLSSFLPPSGTGARTTPPSRRPRGMSAQCSTPPAAEPLAAADGAKLEPRGRPRTTQVGRNVGRRRTQFHAPSRMQENGGDCTVAGAGGELPAISQDDSCEQRLAELGDLSTGSAGEWRRGMARTLTPKSLRPRARGNAKGLFDKLGQELSMFFATSAASLPSPEASSDRTR